MSLTRFASLTVLAAIVAQPALAQSNNFTGVSAAAGFAMTGANTYIDEGGNSGMGYDLGKTSTVALVDVGYGLSLNKNFVLGLGASVDLGKSKLGGVYGTDFVGKSHNALYVQPTWLLSPTTGLFAKVSYQQIKNEFVDGSTTYSMSSKGTGLGLGVKTFINSNVFVQVEASNVTYKAKALDAANSGTAKVSATAGTVSAGYRF